MNCGKTFQAKRRDTRFCSGACRAASTRVSTSRSTGPSAIRSIAVPNPEETLDVLVARLGPTPVPPPQPLRWEKLDAQHIKLTDGVLVRMDGPSLKGKEYQTPRAIAWVFDKGMDRPSWHAAHKKWVIGPAWMEAAGLSMDRPGLYEAKMVAMAMATGDVRPLVLAAHQLDDCTEDMRRALDGMLEILEERVTEDEEEEETELPEVNTEEIMVVRLSRQWCIVEDGGFWILQRRIGDGDHWEWAARIDTKQALLDVVDILVDDAGDEALAVLELLPENAGSPAPTRL
ncbi:hypothetical protein GRZ55_10905 [Chelativorans sp. ZYF759]|uniref:hypothetical protein n=1 Tax=Chelativorans sp. ZYF759 TaxID=2692213 RepID=UPI00145EC364|nr:hypothetical protein [Chelativorans sp. ZYF759]NMG39751.1 hypothetical protein [Chelativorans sp. ZYF759]